MDRTLTTLAVVTLGTWTAFLLYVAAAVVNLTRLDAPTGEVAPALLWPLAILPTSYWVGFRSSHRLSSRTAAIIQLMLLAVGAVFLISVVTPRTM